MKIYPFLLACSLFCPACAAQDTTPVGSLKQGGTLAATYQRLRPAGQTVGFVGRPVDLTLSPDGKTIYAKDNRGFVVLDAATMTLRQELPFGAGGSSMHGIAIRRDGSQVFATTASQQMIVANVGSDGKLTLAQPIALPGIEGRAHSFPCGIALSQNEQRAYVCLSMNNSIGVVDLTAGKLIKEIPVGIAPYDIVLAPDGGTAYVSNWGGRRAKPGDKTAKSAGTDTPVDERGVANNGSVSLIDLEAEREITQIPTGLHPSDMLLNREGTTLYIANANSDTVSVIDTATRRVQETISIRPLEALPFGSAPNALALSPDEQTLFVANGGNNAVAVVSLRGEDTGAKRLRGFIPTGWYPGALAVRENVLYIANIKGEGSRSRPDPKEASRPNRKRLPDKPVWGVYQFLGTVQRVKLPAEDDLKRYTAQVLSDARLPGILRTLERGQKNKKPVPIPARVGEPSVFEHVVYIIKENRTYDQILGDMPQGKGEPSLCIFGREITPNHHALAEQFVLLDNFYCNGVLSADGHSWATEGNVTDHLEKAFGGFNRSYTFGDDPLTYSSSGFLWDNVLAGGLSFRNYGEMDYAEPVPASDFAAIYKDYTGKTGRISFSQNIGVERLRQFSCRAFPGWNMRIPDVLRADVFLKELKEFEAKGAWPNLVIVYLPQDHCSGTSPGYPTPRAHVADNDLALGRVVEGISKSKFWPKTCIFVVEDDPQDGFDHVDGHRSPCLVISPYTKRGKVISQFYNQTSVLHTIQRILGLPPMNQLDAVSPLMTACFTNKPDFRPFTALPNRVPLDEMNPEKSALSGKALQLAEESMALRFDGPDRAAEDGLNRILWHAMKGVDAPYPAHLAGAHGKGLKARRLRLAPNVTPER